MAQVPVSSQAWTIEYTDRSLQPYPSYYFRVDQLLEQTYHPRAHPSQGYWQPPRRRGANRTAPFPATSQQLALGPGRAFYFNGDQLIPQPMQLPQHLVHSYTEYSMYVGEGQELFIVPYDASTNTVYNGVDDGTDPLPPPDHAPDWSELSFERIENSPDRISVAGFRLPHRHLRLWLRRQEWVQQIIPAPYRPQMQTRLNERRDSPQGGLVGNIALMIGLLALSIPPQVVLQALPRLMQRTWDCLPLSAYHGATASMCHMMLSLSAQVDIMHRTSQTRRGCQSMG